MKKAPIFPVMAAVLLSAAPAGAKVAAEAEISGPRLESPLILRDEHAFEYANLSGIAGFREGMTAPRGTPPPGDIGPRYVVRFTLLMRPPREAVQYVFPFADGGPLVYTPAGQRLFTRPAPLESGWAHPDPALLEFLRSSGLPTPERPGNARVGAAWDPRPAFVGIVVLGALLLGAAAIDRRRGVAPTP